MKSKVALFMAAFMFAPSAFAMEITPYVGLGVVIDKAGTSAKRVGLDTKPLTGLMGAPDAAGVAEIMNQAFVRNGGDDMDFDMAFAGEITAGVKIDNVRAELEVALRSASEDDYEVYAGNLPIETLTVPAEIETSTSVRHNSYLANVWYDFELSNSNWTPYIGAGVGFGVYHQKATVEIDIDEDMVMAQLIPTLGQMGPAGEAIMAQMQQNLASAEGEMEVANDTLYRFEWQVGLGATYNFNEDWALDIGYRFNSSTVADEFVYAHEIKLGARYTF